LNRSCVSCYPKKLVRHHIDEFLLKEGSLHERDERLL
jgi:hypothetical protein